MPQLSFQHLTSRDLSPDSVIFTADSNFSLFSSASCSVDRCSFASDVHDQDSLASEISKHLAGHDFRELSSGPDPNKYTLYKNSHLTTKLDNKVKDDNETLDSARSSFSQALKECQDRRSRSEALLKKLERRRPASLDLNNHLSIVTNSSPRFGVLKKSSVLARPTGTFPSPGTPNYRHTSVGMQKGWSSERVPSHGNANRRNVSAALLPFNNGRTLPSKWEDAERWIFSPVSGDGCVRPSYPQVNRRPKSKSGPLGPPGIAYYSMYSPAVPMYEGGNGGNLLASSPFSAEGMGADGLSSQCGGGRGGDGNFNAHTEPCMARSVSVHGCSEVVGQSLVPSSEDEKHDGVKDAATNISRVVSRRDMATQMSPEGSTHSSPKRRPSFSPSTPSILPIVELQRVHSSKPEVRDVQVDERVTMTRWSKKNKTRIPGKASEIVDGWTRKSMEVRSASWEVSETPNSISKYGIKREEAKITAWENLQKAKAEAAIRKLEMKLEKKRSSSMDKIMNKLRSAQKKAQEMRGSVSDNRGRQLAKTSNRVLSFSRTRQIGSLSGCFTCHAF